MQISALNLIIAAQQARQQTSIRASSSSNSVTPAKIAAASQVSAKSEDFVPFAPQIETAPDATATPNAPAAIAPPGSQIDIRV